MPIVGVAEILLVWAAGNFAAKPWLLIVWVGAAALAHAVTDFVLAARLHGLRRGSGGGRRRPERGRAIPRNAGRARRGSSGLPAGRRADR